MRAIIDGKQALTSTQLHKVPRKYRAIYICLLNLMDVHGLIESEPSKIYSFFFYNFSRDEGDTDLSGWTQKEFEIGLCWMAEAHLFRFGTNSRGTRVAQHIATDCAHVRPKPSDLKKYRGEVSTDGVVWDDPQPNPELIAATKGDAIAAIKSE
jgi:hypothetical protein